MIRELLVQFAPPPMVQVCTCGKVHHQLHKTGFEFLRIVDRTRQNPLARWSLYDVINTQGLSVCHYIVEVFNGLHEVVVFFKTNSRTTNGGDSWNDGKGSLGLVLPC